MASRPPPSIPCAPVPASYTICHHIDRQRGALEAVYGAIQSGVLGCEELLTGGRRIAALKDAFYGWLGTNPRGRIRRGLMGPLEGVEHVALIRQTCA